MTCILILQLPNIFNMGIGVNLSCHLSIFRNDMKGLLQCAVNISQYWEMNIKVYSKAQCKSETLGIGVNLFMPFLNIEKWHNRFTPILSVKGKQPLFMQIGGPHIQYFVNKSIPIPEIQHCVCLNGTWRNRIKRQKKKIKEQQIWQRLAATLGSAC